MFGSRIICILHFHDFFDGSGSEDPDPGSHPVQQLLEKFLLWYFREENGSAPPLVDPVMFFYIFSIVKRCGTRFEERDADPGP